MMLSISLLAHWVSPVMEKKMLYFQNWGHLKLHCFSVPCGACCKVEHSYLIT